MPEGSCHNCGDLCCIVDFECATKCSPFTINVNQEEFEFSMTLAMDYILGIVGEDCLDKLCSYMGDFSQFNETLLTPATQPYKDLFNCLKKPISWIAFKFWAKIYGNKKILKNIVSASNSKVTAIGDESLKDWLECTIEPICDMYVTQLKKKLKELNLDCKPCVENSKSNCSCKCLDGVHQSSCNLYGDTIYNTSNLLDDEDNYGFGLPSVI